MATIGKQYVQVVPSAEGIGSKLSSLLSGPSNEAGNSAGLSIGSAIKGALAAAGIGVVLKKAITEGADLQQSIGGVETLFKDSAGAIEKYAADAYKTAGLSANGYMETATGFAASLVSSLKGNTEAAAESANMAITDMADNSNKMGTAMDSIQMAYQGFAKQNYTMLDNLKLGYGGTKTEMERLLQDASKLSGQKYDISNLNDVYSAIHVIQGELGITGTTAKEAATTISGSWSSLKSAASNFLGNLTLGNDIKPSLNALVDTASTFLFQNLIPAVVNIIACLPDALISVITNGLPKFLQSGADLVSNIINGLQNGFPQLLQTIEQAVTVMHQYIIDDLPNILQNGVDMITNFATGMLNNMPTIIQTIGNILMTLVQSILQALPQIMDAGTQLINNMANGQNNAIPQIISSIGTILSNLLNCIMNNLPTILQSGIQLIGALAQGLLNNLPTIISSIAQVLVQLLKTIGEHLPELLEKGIEMIGEIAAGLIQAIPQLIEDLPQIFDSIRDAFGQVDWGELGMNILTGIGNGLLSAVGNIGNVVSQVAGDIWDGFTDFFGIHSPSRKGKWGGQMIDKGFALGISGNTEMMVNAAHDASQETLDAMMIKPSDVDTGMFYSGSDAASLKNAAGSSANGFTQNNNYYSPKALDASESARLTKISTRNMVLSLKGAK